MDYPKIGDTITVLYKTDNGTKEHKGIVTLSRLAHKATGWFVLKPSTSEGFCVWHTSDISWICGCGCNLTFDMQVSEPDKDGYIGQCPDCGVCYSSMNEVVYTPPIHDEAINRAIFPNGIVEIDVTKIDVSQHPDWDGFQWFDYLQKQSKEKPSTLEDILKGSVVIDFTKKESPV